MRESLNIPEADKSISKPNRPSVIWLVPVFAALLAAIVAYNARQELGPLVEIRFATAGGVKAHDTTIRYKDVVVGEVEEVSFSEDLNEVVVHARLEKSMAPHIGETTRFWIVSARVDGTQVSGLNTLLSGSYIEMDWVGQPTERVREFTALPNPPLTKPGTPGRRVTLISENGGSLNVGSEILYRQLSAGRIESRDLSADGQQVVFTAFVDAPFDEYLTPQTRFWNVSGFDVSTGANGVSLNVESLSALVSGGIAFGTLNGLSGETVDRDGATYSIFANRFDAEESFFQFEGQEEFRYKVAFSEPIGGLQPGAPITFEGITVGRVVDVVVEVDRSIIGPPSLYAIVQFDPGRLTDDEVDPAEFRQLIAGLVDLGMRVQLVSGNLLTGSLSMRLTIFDDAEPAVVDFTKEPYPSLPTAASEITALTRNFEDLLASLAQLPLEELILTATQLLRSGEMLLSDPSVKALPEDVALLAKAITSLSTDAQATLQGLSPDSRLYLELTEATHELENAARSISRLADRLEEQPNSLITGRN